MKTSFCSVAYRNTPITLEEIIGKVSEAGYDAIEIWGNHLPKDLDGRQKVSDIRTVLDINGLACSMTAPYFDFTGSALKWSESVEAAKIQCQFAKILGNKLVRAFTGSRGSDEVNIAEWQKGVEGIQEIGKIAASYGLTIALETHPRTLVDNLTATLNFLEAVDSPNVRLNLDIYHFWEVHRDPVKVLDVLFPHISHVHAKNAKLTLAERETTPHPFLHDRQAQQEFIGIVGLGQGDMEYVPFLKLLDELEYEGYISIEWFGESVDEALAGELHFLQQAVTLNPMRSA